MYLSLIHIWVFIPSTVFDNKKLLENDPGYLGTLASLPEAEKQALLYGDVYKRQANTAAVLSVSSSLW